MRRAARGGRRPKAAGLVAAGLVAAGLVAAVAGGGALARADDGPSGPRLALPARELELGVVLQGATVERRLRLRSCGDAPLVVSRVEPSCGCAVVEAPRGPIPPGGEAELVVRFDSSDRLGPQELTLALYTNDPTQADRGRGCALVTLRGEVRTLVLLTPEGAFFGEWVRDPAGVELVVTLAPAEPAAQGFAPRVVEPLPDGVEARLDPERGPGGAARLRVRLRGDAPPGERFGRVLVDTGLAAQPRVAVPVVAIVGGRVAGPRVVEVFDVARASGATRRAALERRDGGEALVVRAVRCPSPHVRARAEPLGPGRAELVVEVVPDAPPGPFATEVEVVLDDPRDPVLVVPVVGTVRPRVVLDPPLALLRPGEAVSVVVRGADPREVTARGVGLGVRRDPAPTPPGARARLVVSAAPDWDGAEGAVVVTTDVEGEERLVLPVLRRD